MCSDLFTKNLDRATFEKHTKAFCGIDGYMAQVEEMAG